MSTRTLHDAFKNKSMPLQEGYCLKLWSSSDFADSMWRGVNTGLLVGRFAHFGSQLLDDIHLRDLLSCTCCKGLTQNGPKLLTAVNLVNFDARNIDISLAETFAV